MTTVTFPTALGGDGSTVSDDNDPVTGLGNGGHRTRFVPSLKNIVAIAQMVVNTTTNLASKASQVDLNATNAELDTLTAVVGTKADSSSVSSSISTINSSLALKAPINNAAFTGTPTAPTPAAGDSSTKIATTAFVDANGVKPGMFADFAGATPPTGYLAIPTAPTLISRSTYARLFAQIGTTWGAGDGSTTFGLPWMLPGDTNLQSSGSNLGTRTDGENKAHSHDIVYQRSNGAGNVNIPGKATDADGNITVSTQSSGGTSNFAAGIYNTKCIKY